MFRKSSALRVQWHEVRVACVLFGFIIAMSWAGPV
jgi:hypothetical protein